MGKVGEAGFVLSKREFVFLAAMTGANQLVGIDDDASSLSEDELVNEWEKVRVNLEKKKYIEVELDDSVTIDEDLFELVRACGFTQKYLRFHGSIDNGIFKTRSCYILDNIAVQLDDDPSLPGSYILSPYNSMDNLVQSYTECLEFQEEYKNDDIMFELSQADFDNLIDEITRDVVGNATEKIQGLGINDEDLKDFLSTLRAKKIFKTLLLLDVSDEGAAESKNLSAFQGQKYLWSFEIPAESTSQIITIKTYTNNSIKEKFMEYIYELAGSTTIIPNMEDGHE